MKIKTSRFGTISIDQEAVIDMPLGMPGFPALRQFVLLPHHESSPFSWYQSLEDPFLAFVVTNPCLFLPDYSVNLDHLPPEVPWEPAAEDRHFEAYVVVNIPRGAPEKITANLMGPILIDRKTRRAVQLIMPDSPWSHQFPLVAQKQRPGDETNVP